MNFIQSWRRRRKHLRHSSKFAAKYPYNLEPSQFVTLVEAIDALADKPGCIVEVGCYRGWSTMFVCEHLKKAYPKNPPPYYALDTFDSFVGGQLDHEVAKRSKVRKELEGFFNNDYDIWSSNFKNYPFVRAIKADCANFSFSQLGPIKVALLDVDLYVPTAAALAQVYPALVDGGVILVDDVRSVPVLDDPYPYDGAHQAYMEFCAAHELSPAFVGTKCGLIRRESGTDKKRNVSRVDAAALA